MTMPAPLRPDGQNISGLSCATSAIPAIISAPWHQNGPTDQGMCLIEIANRISVEITGSQIANVLDEEVQRVAEIIMAAPVLVNLLARLEPYLGAIVCYASSIDEHEPNGVVADIHGWLGHLRDCAAISRAEPQP